MKSAHRHSRTARIANTIHRTHSVTEATARMVETVTSVSIGTRAAAG